MNVRIKLLIFHSCISIPFSRKTKNMSLGILFPHARIRLQHQGNT